MYACCPLCKREQGALLGMLGNRIHFRCIACGGDFSTRFQKDDTCVLCDEVPLTYHEH